MATDTVVPSVESASPAPSIAPAATPAPSMSGASLPSSSVDPAKHPIREEYAAALLKERLAAIPAQPETAAEQPSSADMPEMTLPAEPAQEPSVEEPGGADALEQPSAATDAPAQEEAPQDDAADDEMFELELEPVVTPDLLSKMIGDNPDFGKLLDADPRLKGQLFKTAREAAELKPYRELFADLDSAKTAQGYAETWMDVRETFLGSTTRDGAVGALAKIAELSYERDANGEPVLHNGQPVIGEDFFGFVDNVVGLDLEHRAQQVEERLKAGLYRTSEERDRDERVKAALEILREESPGDNAATEALPESLQRRQEELDRRERALQAREHGDKVAERGSFESALQAEAQKRIGDGIAKILANVENQGGAISPYLKNILPRAIGAKLVRKIQANPVLQGQMQELQRLPVGDASRQRRLAAIDRAVQQYLPEVAREELREAGVQTMNASATRRAKAAAQADNTLKTEPKGSTGAGSSSGAPLSSSAAFDHAQSEWQRANPGRPFDKVAKEQILPRVIQLMTAR